jgi:hypothetical protein
MNVISQDLIKEIRNQYRLNWHGIHGISHFLRVRDIGIRLAETTGVLHICDLAFLSQSRIRRLKGFQMNLSPITLLS